MKTKRNGDDRGKISHPWLTFRTLALMLGLVASSAGCDPDPGGTTSTSSTGSTGDGTCNVPEDCPVTANECLARGCVNRTCGIDVLGAGTKTSAQTPGDCKRDECDGTGVIVSKNDDADVPVDNETCTQDVCTNGVPSNPAVTAGTVCSEGTGQLCDATGRCVECLVANDCAGIDDECKTRTCTATGVCGLDLKPSGTVLAAQTAFDCRTLKCDGNGAIIPEIDDADQPPKPADFAGCMLPGCSGGTLSDQALPDDTGCLNGDGCTQGDTCQAGTCMAGPPVSCGPVDPCVNAMCISQPVDTFICILPPKPDGATCGSEQICNAGICESSCLIGGTFYAAGTANPASDCQVCTPGISTSAWSNKADGTACPFGSCGAGSCIKDPIAYIKASNTGANDLFGYVVALSADGNTLAVGAYAEDSIATGINGDQTSNSLQSAGAVYVFTRSGGTWSQQAYVKASNPNPGDAFGYRVSLSGDGNTLAVGAFFEDSNATGINGDQTNNTASTAGAVYMFARSGGTWSQEAYVKASNTGATDSFGASLALSGDGNTLAVGAGGEDSNATGINGNQADNAAIDSGAVYVFTRGGGNWSQQAYVKASNTEAGDAFGARVTLSGDGNTLAVGAAGEDSNATGINGNQTDNAAGGAGAVYVLTRSGGTWSQQAYVKASNTEATDAYGFSVALSADGNTLAVGAAPEDSNATGINGDQADNAAIDSGAVYVLTRSGGTWSQEAYVKASNTNAGDVFGGSVALSANGNTLAVGAGPEDSNATGFNGNQTDNAAIDSGAVYVFTRSGGTWSQETYVKASNTDAGDDFGGRVALSGDGTTMAVGARFEDSNAIGINGDQADNSATSAGAVYVYSGAPTPASCQDVKQAMPGTADGEYTLYVSGDAAKSWKAYCKDMAGTPIEYLTLVNTMNANFSQYTAGGFSPGTNVRTVYTKLRIDPVTFAIDANDQTYATSTGTLNHAGMGGMVTSMPYGVAADCVGNGIPSGVGNIDLTGTPFAVVAAQFALGGAGPVGTTTYGASNRTVGLTAGGACGWNAVTGSDNPYFNMGKPLQLVYAP